MTTETPDRAAVETLAGNVRVGDVVDESLEVDADTRALTRVYTVEIDGHRFRTPADEAGTP